MLGFRALLWGGARRLVLSLVLLFSLLPVAKSIAFAVDGVDEGGAAFGFDFAAQETNLGGEDVAGGGAIAAP